MKRIALFLIVLLTGWVAGRCGGRVTVASYNLRYANHSDSVRGDGWGKRCPHVVALCRLGGFDIFGTQEGLYPQLQDLKSALPGFDYIGIGREDGKRKGEHSAIFYRTDRFELLDHGNFWLAQDADNPTLGWDAACVRICTWGRFRDRQSGFEFVFYNLHMDHVGEVARAESARLILKRISELPEGCPVILTGDFNVDQHSESYRLLECSTVLEDSYTVADFAYAPCGTFNDYKTGEYNDSRIDHIFLTPDVFKVENYGIMTNTYRDEKGARNPSDHYPVVVRLAF